jgi:hypothetical protein
MRIELEQFLKGYLTAALFSTTDGSDESGGVPLDRNYTLKDFSFSALEIAKKDCKAFQDANAADLADIPCEDAGRDFWFTRNRHGTGFWDRGYPADIAHRLTEAAHVYGAVDLFVHSDGLIY